MKLFPKKPFPTFQKWAFYSLLTLIFMFSIVLFGIITYTQETSKTNSRRVFESSLWNSLQLQVQYYRFLNYLETLDDADFPINGKAFFEYDLLMSRMDLLRKGDIGSLIRDFEEGRIARLLNIINAEMELLSFNLTRIESGDSSYLPNLVERIRHVQHQINELITLINKANTIYVHKRHNILQSNLGYIQLLSFIIFIGLGGFSFLYLKSLSRLKIALNNNTQLKNKIETTKDDQSNLISFIYQELRTPISAILGIAKTLNKMDNIPPKTMSLHIEESGQQLLQSIEMFSDLALIEAKKLSLTPTTEHLRTVIEDYLISLQPLLLRKNLQCVVFIDPELPSHIHCDFTRLIEIITTLIQNAIANTQTKNISLQVRPSIQSVPHAVSTAEFIETQRFQIAIKDTGQTIQEQLQKKLRTGSIFSPEENTVIDNKSDFNLILCQKLVHLMEGQFHFSCNTESGCEFWIDLPLHCPQELQTQTPSQHESLAGKHILLIENDDNMAQVIHAQLRALGITPIRHEDLYLLHNRDIDIILLGNGPVLQEDDITTIKDWYSSDKLILSYHSHNIQTTEFPITSLHFPLMQGDLENLLLQGLGARQQSSQND